ncbi:MAG TPA: ribbon-helix-helix domain-containing protein [Alphaproteobacteria bacterium]|nr:ribbon-helix-helix domain-containing protein [Alphaproteobacteria bacterium]
MTWGNEELFKTSRQVSRNVVVSGRRTSMRLESSLWDALEEIAQREGGSVNELCGRIDARRGDMSLTGAVRAALVCYYRDMVETAEMPVSKGFGVSSP